MENIQKSTPKKDIAIFGIIAILLLMTFFQSIELGRLRGYVQAQELQPASQVQSASTRTAQPTTGLPRQVGGC